MLESMIIFASKVLDLRLCSASESICVYRDKSLRPIELKAYRVLRAIVFLGADRDLSIVTDTTLSCRSCGVKATDPKARGGVKATDLKATTHFFPARSVALSSIGIMRNQFLRCSRSARVRPDSQKQNPIMPIEIKA